LREKGVGDEEVSNLTWGKEKRKTVTIFEGVIVKGREW